MAENELTIVPATGGQKSTRSADLGDDGTGTHVHGQYALVAEAREKPVDPTGGLVRYTVGTGAVVALSVPTAITGATSGFFFARLRVFETTTKDGLKRLYYRQDGTNPQNTGANVTGYLTHGEIALVKLASFANFKMIGDSTDAGSFEVYVEWLQLPPI